MVYSLFYVCRMALSVVKQPVVDGGIMSPSQIGLVSSAMLLVYAVGKFVNGFIADYCNIRRFMATGLAVSSAANLIMGILGFLGDGFGLSTMVIFLLSVFVWGANGWAQSMGAAPGVISLSRWFPLKSRGTFYGIFCATPYLGKFLSMILLGQIVLYAGWQWGFIAAAAAGLAGLAVALAFISDTPESRGLPSVRELSGEPPQKADDISTGKLHRAVIRHPGIWIIALSSAFVYITQYGISNWGVFFLQKAKGLSLAEASGVVGVSEGIGVAGTVMAGWISDRLFRGDRLKPVIVCGLVGFLALGAFLLTGGGTVVNILWLSLSSLAIASLYCIVSGLMALDIVPRKATGAALGIVGISSYVAAAVQDVISGFLIQGGRSASAGYDFMPVAVFWLAACLVSIVLPVWGWRHMKNKVA